MRNIFGEIEPSHEKHVIFQDESGCEISNYFYIGLLFVKDKRLEDILNILIDIKERPGRRYRYREIHFNELNQPSWSQNGHKTKIAIGWLKNIDQFLISGDIRYYFFGVNRNHLSNFWQNERSYEENIYLRFLGIALKSGIRWFSIGNQLPLLISAIYMEKGNYDEDRIRRVQWLSNQFDFGNYSEHIDFNNIAVLSSNEVRSESSLSNYLQLTDVLTGTCRSSFVEPSSGQRGQKECVSSIIDVIERFNNKNSAYNPNSRYYKKFVLSFFPTKSNLSREEFLSMDLENIMKRGQYYVDRKTYRQERADIEQLKLGL